MLAALHTYRHERGLPTATSVTVPEGGATAADVAGRLELPLEMIQGLFLNGFLVGLGATVQPGDRVAFVPYGTPAPHPAFFGRHGIEEHALR
jgi:hypothetical protein